jgi:hypothetical protein
MKKKHALNLILLLAVTVGITACGGNDKQAQQAEQEHVAAGIAVTDTDDPNRWAPSPEAVEQAKKDAAAPPIQLADDGSTDIGLGEMEKPPVPPEPPKLANGDEADQYGLPAWDQIAHGDLKVKRIHY